MAHDTEEEQEATMCFLFSDVFMARLCLEIDFEQKLKAPHQIQPGPCGILTTPIMISMSAFPFQGKSQNNENSEIRLATHDVV